MPDNLPTRSDEFEIVNALFIVVGAHLRGEIEHRPLAYELQELIDRWLSRHDAKIHDAFEPIVCCDIWYVNHPRLQLRPTVSIGQPSCNALSAYLEDRLPQSRLAEDVAFSLRLDEDLVDLRVGLWGTDDEQTAAACNLFQRRWLDAYLRAVVTQVEPQVDG